MRMKLQLERNVTTRNLLNIERYPIYWRRILDLAEFFSTLAAEILCELLVRLPREF